MQNNDDAQISIKLSKLQALLDELVKANEPITSPEMLNIWNDFQATCIDIADPSIWIEQVSLRLRNFNLPENAASLAVVCGGLIENGIAPNQFFESVCTLLEHYIGEFQPFVGIEPNENDEQYANNQAAYQQDLKNWHNIEKDLATLSEEKKAYLTNLAGAINYLVLPIMACIIHHDEYLEIFKSKHQFIDKINQTYFSDLFNIDHLYYLSQMATMSNLEMVILLYSSKAGMIVRGRHIRNGFHAMELIQPLLTQHKNHLEIGKINPEVLVDEPVQKTLYSWAPWSDWQAVGGPSTVPFILGEPSIDIWPKWQEKVVLVAVEKTFENMYNRSWKDMTDPIHVGQNSELDFIRYLTAEEVDELMLGNKAA